MRSAGPPVRRMRRPVQASTFLLLLLLLASSVGVARGKAAAPPPGGEGGPTGGETRRLAVEELRRLVPPPSSRELGGEAADSSTYERFLSVAGWDPERAAPRIRRDFAWRRKVRPRQLRPADCPILSRQHAWRCLVRGKPFVATGKGEDDDDDGGGGGGGKGSKGRGGSRPRPLPLDPPHTCPPLQAWRTTRHGLPITYFQSWLWRPDLAPRLECERHIAYHIDHFIRRMGKGVTRTCIIFDMSGFESWMLSYIKASVDILRLHYPGRAGAMCFINCPSYFLALWKIISPWLDDEIRSKTFFAPKSVDDGEKAIAYLNKMSLKVGPD